MFDSLKWMGEWMEVLAPAASTYASDIDVLIVGITLIVGFWLILAEAVLFYFVFRFRRKEGRKAQYITGEEKHQKQWISKPHFLVLLCDVVVIIGAVMVWYDVKQDLPPPDEEVRVIAQQWGWSFVHAGQDGMLGTDDDIETGEELHMKVGSVYHFHLESRDVLHCFSVPVFRVKQDIIPGRVITGWVKPTKTGTFDLQCAEMCGIGHGIMSGKIIVHSPEEHRKWMAQNTPHKSGEHIVVREENQTMTQEEQGNG